MSKEPHITGHDSVSHILGEVDLSRWLGKIAWLFAEKYPAESELADRWCVYFTSQYGEAENRTWITLRFEGCDDVKLPTFSEFFSLARLEIQCIADRQWERLAYEVRCLNEDYEWYEGLLWLRCSEIRIVMVHRNHSTPWKGDVVWADFDNLPSPLQMNLEQSED